MALAKPMPCRRRHQANSEFPKFQNSRSRICQSASSRYHRDRQRHGFQLTQFVGAHWEAFVGDAAGTLSPTQSFRYRFAITGTGCSGDKQCPTTPLFPPLISAISPN
jgi:hypothetical protein